MTDPSTFAHAREYIGAGWALCATQPKTKKAYGGEWQKKSRPVSHWERNPNDGMGLIHGLSGTCSIDLDDLENAHIAFRAVGVDLAALLDAPNAVRIIGAPGRGKLIYRAPAGLTRCVLNWPDPEDNSKRRAILELRAGDTMDVLPPSIHPATGQPYRWVGDWRHTPELPAELLAVWEHWTDARREMEAACPWIESDPDAERNRYEGVTVRTYAEGESVIEAFNAAHSIRPIIEAFGYRKAGPRYISPFSKSGLPGVVFLPGSEGRLIYVHHASDPLCDGHAHDAFSVWCQLQHSGDVTTAVREAAEMIGMAYSQMIGDDAAAEGAAIAARLMNRHNIPDPPERETVEVRDEKEEGPTDPIPIPALASLEYWLRLKHWGAKSYATTQGALAFAAAMTARRYLTADRQPTNVMLGVVDTSVAGMLPLRGLLYEAADRSGQQAIIRGEDIPSAPVLRRALLRWPRMFWVSADYGYMVGMHRKQTSGAYRSALDAILEVYEGSTQYVSPETVGGRNVPLSECKIHWPGFAALILASTDQMRDIAQRSQYGRGAVQQILFARANESTGYEAGTNTGAPVPESVIENVRAIMEIGKQLGGLQEKACHPPDLVTVPLGPGSRDAFEELRARLGSLFLDDRFRPWRGMAKGAFVTANRLVTSLAAWRDPEDPLVTIDLVEWVGNWVTYHLTNSVEWYAVVATEEGESTILQEAQRIIYEAGAQGITSSAMRDRSWRWRNTKSDERKEIIEQLVEDRLIYERPSPGGRTVLYVDRSYISTEEIHV